MNTLQDFVDKICPECGKSYKADPKRLKHGRQTTCSRQCSYSMRARLKRCERTYFVCPVCLSEFSRTPSEIKPSQSHYCSQDCAYKGRTLGTTKRRVTKPYNIVHSQKNRITVKCRQCDQDIETIPALRHRKRFCSRQCHADHLKVTMRGKHNPFWLDGRSRQRDSYRGSDWSSQRRKTYKRDNYTCQSCGVKCIGRKDLTLSNGHHLIQCHHIVLWSETQDNSLENLVTLCASCHRKVHSNNLNLADRIAAYRQQNGLDPIVVNVPSGDEAIETQGDQQLDLFAIS